MCYIHDMISIHAPRAGSDLPLLLVFARVFDFNPRSPCGERLALHLGLPFQVVFQSTLPVRGATYGDVFFGGFSIISIHAPRAGSDLRICFSSQIFEISIHAPRAGSDVLLRLHVLQTLNFNPRSPCGERRGTRCPTTHRRYFNPRSPCGERHLEKTL